MADGVALRLNSDPSTGLPEYSAKDERLLAAMPLMPGQSPLRIREGRRLGPGLEVAITPDGLFVTVQPGLAVVQHAVNSGGDYQVAIPAVVTRALGAKPGAGLKRRDTVVVDVADEDVGEKPTGLREANIGVLVGDATAGAPTAPAAGTMQFEIGQLHFDGTNTPIINPTNPRYTWAAGGVGVVFSQAEEDGILGAYDGMKIYRDDLDRFRERVAGAFRNEGGSIDDTGWLASQAGTVVVNSGWADNGSRIRKRGNWVRLELSVTRVGADIASGDFADSLVATVAAAYRGDAATYLDPSPQLSVVGRNNSGGAVAFRLMQNTGELYATSSHLPVANSHIVRAVFDYYTD